MQPILKVDNLSHKYASSWAIREINFEINDTGVVGLLGSNGAGKSTTMNILGCLDVPTSGAYLFRGMRVDGFNRDQRSLLRRRYLGFVFQGFNLLARTTALENVELPLLYRGEDRHVRRELALAALDLVGLRNWSDHNPSELSGGQQQRVAIARALVTQPDVLLADEPTGNLDSERSVEIMELLSELNAQRGLTVLLVTHEPDMAAYARRIVHFKDGLVDRVENGASATLNAASAPAP